MKYLKEYEKYVKDLGGMSYNAFVKERCEGPDALVVGDIFTRCKNKNGTFCQIESINYVKKRCFVYCYDSTGKFIFDAVVKSSELLDRKTYVNVTDSCSVELEAITKTPESDILWDLCL